MTNFIDLGLPSGTLWADRNVGAEEITDFGDYLTFDEAKDIAPTIEQIKELLHECESEWAVVNGVNGRKVTGPNGNSIFLPAARNRWSDYTNIVGSYGYYWSSTQYSDYPYYAYNLYFSSGYMGWYNNYRYNGQSVRQVKSSNLKKP